MPFERFTDTGRSHAAKASIGHPSGLLGFNDAARRRFKMDDFGFVVLFYDRDSKIVGVQLTGDEKSEGAKKLRLRTTGADVSARGFLDYFAIKLSATTAYDVGYDEEGKMILLDLSKGKERKNSRGEELESNPNEE